MAELVVHPITVDGEEFRSIPLVCSRIRGQEIVYPGHPLIDQSRPNAFRVRIRNSNFELTQRKEDGERSTCNSAKPHRCQASRRNAQENGLADSCYPCDYIERRTLARCTGQPLEQLNLAGG